MILYNDNIFMASNYWIKQTINKPLFPDMLWSKPENKLHAGKLLIIGGNAHGFAAPATAFSEAGKAGIGTSRVLLPDAVQKIVGSFLPEAEYGPSTPSGSFAQKSLDTWLECSTWSDGVLVAGDLGRNSETAIVLEKYLTKYSGQLTLTKDSIDYCNSMAQTVLARPETTLVLSFAQLQKLAIEAKYPHAFTFDMGLVRLVDTLHDFTNNNAAAIVTKYLDSIIVAVNGQVSTTKLSKDIEVWRVATAAHNSVWWLQHPTQQFQSLTTSLAK